jgi:hypothetical protein
VLVTSLLFALLIQAWLTHHPLAVSSGSGRRCLRCRSR